MHSLRIVPPNSNLSGRCDFWAKKKAPPVGETFLYVGITYLPGKCNVLSCRWDNPVDCPRHIVKNEEPHPIGCGVCVLALPIFPASHPASIVGADELNFCVRDGNRWTLIAINTNYLGWVLPIIYVKTLVQVLTAF